MLHGEGVMVKAYLLPVFLLLSIDVHALPHVEIDLGLQYILEMYSFTVCLGDVVQWGDVFPFR